MPTGGLNRRQLGSSGLDVTVLGLGTWGLAGGGTEGYGPQRDSDSIATIQHAVARGISWIDTAPIYGLGHAEEVVGQALRAIPASSRPLIFTKCGLIPDPARPYDRPRRVLDPQSMRRELEGSLRRLGVPTIDLYQVHRPDETGIPIEDSWGEMGRFIEEGKIKAAGVSNFTVAELEAYEAIRHIDSLQPKFSLIHRDAADLISWCRAHGTGVLAYGPMAAGLLTDGFSAERVAALPDDDWRKADPFFSGPLLRHSLALRDALVPLAHRHSTTVAAVALAWVLAWPGVTAAIAGARRPGQIDDWIDAASIELLPEDLDAVNAAIESSITDVTRYS